MSDRPGRAGRPVPLRIRRRAAWANQPPTWREARPAVIADALKRATARPSGNWFVVGASRRLRAGGRPYGRTVGGAEIVLWRSDTGELRAGPGSCPHLGAPLRDSRVVCGTLVCHWHGLALDGGRFAGWEPYPVHEEGVGVWVG
ncbi:Rieske (2Fe-2S) protein, partial [Streptomyces sp. NPDC058953]|uniref:Rieske (2Fe-2S) protein n=1 Tax=Streptomyces sp. NPDC058953 TaxID=3346676 RepID=UPI0036995D70